MLVLAELSKPNTLAKGIAASISFRRFSQKLDLQGSNATHILAQLIAMLCGWQGELCLFDARVGPTCMLPDLWSHANVDFGSSQGRQARLSMQWMGRAVNLLHPTRVPSMPFRPARTADFGGSGVS